MRERAPTKTLMTIIEKAYRQQYFRRYRDPSAMKLSGRQRTRLKELMEIISISEICRRLEKYFEDKSDWLQERHHPWNVFVTNIDQYGGKDGKGKGDGRGDWIKDEIENYQRRKNR